MADLDGLRGIAVLMVFLTHAWSFSGSAAFPLGGGFRMSTLLTMFNTGVELFFVMSGFLVSRRFIEASEFGRPRPSLRRYLRERCFRILPLYWFLLVLVPLAMTPWLVKEDRVFSVDGLVAFASYLPVMSALFPWSFGQFFAISPVWTLTVEALFYAAVPFVASRFAQGRSRSAVGLSLAISLGWLAFLRSVPGTSFATWFGSIGSPELPGRDFGRILLSTMAPTFAFAFAAGISVAAVASRRAAADLADVPPRSAQWLVPGGVVTTVVVLWLLGIVKQSDGLADPFLLVRSTDPSTVAFYFLQHLAPVVGFTLVLAGLVLDGRRHRIIGSAPLRVIGILGYGVYMWHFPVLFSHTGLRWVIDLGPTSRFFVVVLFGGATSLGLSIASWFAIERPWMRRGRRHRAEGMRRETAPDRIERPIAQSSSVCP